MIRLSRNLKYSRIISSQVSAFLWRTFCEQVWPAACQGHVLQSTDLHAWGWCSSEAGPGTILFHTEVKENASLHNSVSAIYFQLHIHVYLNGGLNSCSAFPDHKQSSGTVLGIWDSVFVFTIPLDEVVCTKWLFATASSTIQHFNPLKNWQNL